ncbi:MAG: beta-L-arabinofuranosidase domain-containing protein [Planctomycetota bacterium]
MRTRFAYEEVPLSTIHPEGWLRRYLEIQRDGLTGHLEHAGFPFDTPGWSSMQVPSGGGEAWWPYEQTGYWIDGMTRCGYLLGDAFLIAKARRHIDFVLSHPDEDGYLGPPFMKESRGWHRWPHAVFFRALMAHYSATGDSRVVPALVGHYLSDIVPNYAGRDVCNVEIMLWLYGQTGDRRLLGRAVDTYVEYNRLFPGADTSLLGLLSPNVATEHGVTYNEIGKLGAIVYAHTGKKRYLDAAVNAWRKIDQHHLLIDGVNSSAEALKGKDPLDSHETCDIADFTWSVGYLLLVTGKAEYADKIERACFNAAPGAVRADFKALQYFSCPNQVIATATSNHNEFFRGQKWMSYRPNPGTECCPGAVNRIMPNLAARMWLRDQRGGLVAALYGPCRITAEVGSGGTPVTIVEETDYPFSERIDFQIRTAREVAFPLSVRIPGWCRRARIEVNGRPWRAPCLPGSFVTIRRTFVHNDRITLHLPMDLRLSYWPRGGIGIERGPLVFALRIEEDWRVDPTEARATKEFPAWNLYPASPWNYALCVDEARIHDGAEVMRRPCSPEPWTIDAAPIELRVPARRIKGWRIERRKSVRSYHLIEGKLGYETVRGDFMLTPQLPDPESLPARLSGRLETVTLVPYGCTRLRLAVFPRAP